MGVQESQAEIIWDAEGERLGRADLAALQLRRLQVTVRRAYDKVEFYRRRMDEQGVRPEDIRSLDDIRLLPFTTKSDLREQYPFGFLAVPLAEVMRLHASSGTTGKPVVAAYTRSDLSAWGSVMARSLAATGVKPQDLVHNAYGYGLFTGGLGFHLGAEELGCAVLPISGGQTRRQVMMLSDLGATVLACTPSYAMVIGETAREMGVDLKKEGRLRVGVFGAEPWSEAMRRAIEELLGLEAYDVYGLTEITGPGVAIECSLHQGLHIHEDYFYPELIDPETGEAVPPGEKGELCLTVLSKEAMPLLRFRTRDLTRLRSEVCGCGRTTVRMDRLSGRTDDMLIIRGVNVFPSDVEAVLLREGSVTPNYQIVVDREHNLDSLTIQVEPAAEVWDKGQAHLEGLSRRLAATVKDYLAVAPKITLAEPGSLPRSEGKAKRVIDRRPK